MYTIEELISEGMHIVENYKKEQHTEVYTCMKGTLYECWMGKVALYTEQMPNGIIKEELQKLYNKRNKYLNTSGAEKVIGTLAALKDTNILGRTENKMKVFISHSSKDKNMEIFCLIL